LYFRGSARLESFSIVLKIRRTLVGAEIDEAIAHALAGEAAAIERIRRRHLLLAA